MSISMYFYSLSDWELLAEIRRSSASIAEDVSYAEALALDDDGRKLHIYTFGCNGVENVGVKYQWKKGENPRIMGIAAARWHSCWNPGGSFMNRQTIRWIPAICLLCRWQRISRVFCGERVQSVRKVRVDLGEKSYDILIGNHLEAELQQFIQQAGYSHRALLLSDTNVGPLYGRQVLDILEKAGLQAELYEIPAGESSKSLAEAEKIFTKAIEMGLDRKSPVFALGGGVVGDLAGFIAATYMICSAIRPMESSVSPNQISR